MPVTYKPPVRKPLPVFPKPTVVDEIITPSAVPAAVPSIDQAAPVTESPKSAVDQIITPPVAEPQPTVATAAAGPGPGGNTGDVTTGDVLPDTPGASGQDAWEIDPILGGGTRDIPYRQEHIILDPSGNVQQRVYAIDKETGERVEIDLGGMSTDYIKIFDPPSDIDPIAKQRWIELNDKLRKDLTTYFAAGPKVERLGGQLPNPDGPEGLFRLFPGAKAIIDNIQNEQKNIIKTTSTNAGQPPPDTSAGGTTVPESGTGGTPGQEATGGTGTGTTTPTTGTPPVTQTTPFAEGELTKTAQQKYDDFIKTSPADHPGGIAGWQNERNALRDAAKAESSTATPAGSTAIGADENIESDAITGAVYEPLLKKLIEDGYELSSEEEATIRRNVDTAVRQSLSGLSARGLGRGSESAGAIVQGEIAKEQQVGEAKARVRKEGTEAGLRATELLQSAQNLNLNKTVADRNYQLAVAGHNLADLKNSQDVSFQDRAMQLKTMESKAAIAQMEKEFGLKIDELEWKKFIETGELDAKLLDITGTQRLNEIKIVNDYWLAKSDLELQEKLGVDKIELQKWMAGEEFDIARGSQALERMFKEMDFDIDRAKIEAALRAGGTDGWEIALGILSLGATILG